MAFFISGCATQKVYQRIGEAFEAVTNDQVAYSRETQSREISLSWKQALSILEQHNSQLARGKVRLADIEKERSQFAFRELSPRVTALASLTTSLANIASFDSDSAGIQLLSTIQIPDPFTAYARRYALELQYYSSKLEYEELVRLTHASLYETFLTEAEIDQSARDIKRPSSQPTTSVGISRDLFRQLNQEKQRKQLNLERRKNLLQRRLNSLLNSPKQRYRLRYETLPTFDYETRYQKLSFESGFGSLALKQTAGEIEAARADLWRVKIERYPPLNLNVSLPSLYDSQSNTGPEFDDIRLFSGSSKSFEFTGREARTVRSAEERAKYIRDQIQLNLANEAYNFKQLKLRYGNFLKAEQRSQRALDYYDKNPPLPSPSLVVKRIEEVERLRDELTSSQSYRRRTELEFWVWDEKYWKSPF